MDKKDETILMLAERLYICSRLLTRAAEKLGWNTLEVRELVTRLRVQTAIIHGETLAEVQIDAYLKERSESGDEYHHSE